MSAAARRWWDTPDSTMKSEYSNSPSRPAHLHERFRRRDDQVLLRQLFCRVIGGVRRLDAVIRVRQLAPVEWYAYM